MKIKNTIQVIALALLFASCDYLDIKPVGKVIPEKTTLRKTMKNSERHVIITRIEDAPERI